MWTTKDLFNQPYMLKPETEQNEEVKIIVGKSRRYLAVLLQILWHNNVVQKISPKVEKTERAEKCDPIRI